MDKGILIKIPTDIRVYWSGKYSECIPNGSIETFIKHINVEKSTSFLFFQNDGIMSDNNFKEVVSSTSETRIVIIPETTCDRIESYAKNGTIPVICALSTRGTIRDNILLLPLDDYTFQYGLEDIFKNVKKIPWEDRISQVFWRGNLGGYERPSIREKVVAALFNNKNSDVKFAFFGYNGEYANTIDQKYIVETRSELQDFLHYKYLLIVDGVNIASNHQWTFGSGSVPIMVTHPENNWWFKTFLKPMENYVPVKYDLSDLEEKIQWLVDNDDKAREIANNALTLSKEIFTHDYQSRYLYNRINEILTLNKDHVVMRNISFRDLCIESDTDKITHHGYDRFYPIYLDKLRESATGMLEIGILEHTSVFLWKKYFLNAHIYGIDIDEKQSNDNRVTIFKADQSNYTDLINVIKQINHPVQLIIDDGSHIPEHQILSFNVLFENLLQPGGVYIVEDIETSYWSHNGLYGYPTNYGYRHPNSFIEKVKPIIDKINCEFLLPIHNKQNSEILYNFTEQTLSTISTITFGQNCVIFTKKSNEDLMYYNNRPYRFIDNL